MIAVAAILLVAAVAVAVRAQITADDAGHAGLTRAALPLGPVARGRRISFDLLLTLPGAVRLQKSLAAAENPRSPRYRTIISAVAFGRRFGISATALRRLRRMLARDRIRVLTADPQRTELTVTATVGVVERLFGVTLYADRDGAHRYTLVRGAVMIPTAWRSSVTGVTGLDTEPREVAHDVPLSGLDPVAAADAYDVTALHRAGYDGQGQTIALISFSSYDSSDPAAFARRDGLSGPAPQVIPIDGGAGADDVAEANLDIDVIRGIAPAARILVYEVPSTSSAYADAINAIVAGGHAAIISSSWGQCELGLATSERRAESTALTGAVAAGVSAFIATGDAGAYDCQAESFSDTRLSVDWPASSADAVAVGGTRLYLTPSFGYLGETAWEDQLSQGGGGGGVSVYDARPAWQSGPGVDGPWSDGRRQVPDVSADADVGTPWSLYVSGGTATAGGTSASAPFWAAAMALIAQYAHGHGITHLGFVDPTLYALARTDQPYPPFHDVTRGGNRYYQAGPGWDPATGLGSPDVYDLARDVVAYLRVHPAHR